MKINKHLLALGSIAVVATSSIPIIACGSDSKTLVVPPNNQLPVVPSANVSSVTPTDTQQSKGKPPVVQSKRVLDERILDLQTIKNIDEVGIKDAFSKFTKDIKFDDPATSIYGMLGKLNKTLEFDKGTKCVKLMIMGQRAGKNEAEFYCGVLGIVNGDLKFMFYDFDSVNKISDNPTSAAMKDLKLNHQLPGEGFDKLVFVGIGADAIDKIVEFLKTTTDREFPGVPFTLKLTN